MNDETLQVIDLLDRAELRPGDDVFVHSGLSQFGGIRVDSRTVIDHLTGLIGESGTLLMPAYPYPLTMPVRQYCRSEAVFDVRKSRTHMGILPAVFLARYPVQRSLHPWASVAALGANAGLYTADHHTDPTPFGAHSPFFRLAERKGRILLLGVDFRSLTAVHVPESLRPDYPVKVYEDDPAFMDVIDRAGNRTTIEVRVPEKVVKPNWNKYARYLNRKAPVYSMVRHRKGRMAVIDAEALQAELMREVDSGHSPYDGRFRYRWTDRLANKLKRLPGWIRRKSDIARDKR